MAPKNRHGGCCCGGDSTIIGIGIPGCLCQNMPANLSLVVSYGLGEDTHTYSNALQSCDLAYYTTTPPGYLPQSAFTGAAYYSTTSWVDDFGFTDYYRLNCFGSIYTLFLGQNNLGIWQSPAQVYNWSMGGSPIVNTCSYGGVSRPFALLQGRTQQGVVFNGKFVVQG